MAQKKTPSSSSGSPIGRFFGNLARVIFAAFYGVIMSVALAYIPVYFLLSASYGTVDGGEPQFDDNQEQQSVSQVSTRIPAAECAGGANWWSANRSIYDSFAASMSELFTGFFDIESVTADLRNQRNNFSTAQFPECIGGARSEFLAGMDETITAFGESDPIVSEQHFLTGKDHFAAAIVIMWQYDISTDPTSAPLLDLPQGGGADCEAQSWYNAGRSVRENFLNAFANVNPNVTREQWEDFVDDQRDIRDQYAALEYPECAAAARQHFINLMDAILDSYQHAIDLEIDATFSDFERLSYELQFYTNWKRWLGINASAADY